MRIHALTISAFGSFGGTEHLDVEQLSRSGLFLLHGPTGAGKTTLLDAVSFALFGAVPGARRGGEGLRSHHAEPGLLTEVTLEVTFGANRYRIVRQPKQTMPKQRGEGLTEKPAKVSVEELVDGGWVTRATRSSEAEHLLATHLPMDADQFHQVVMLPQGEFATFLRATAEERRGLLEKLFATQRFAEVERWLKEQADAATEVVGQAEDRLRRDLAAIGAVANVDVPDDIAVTAMGQWARSIASETAERVQLEVADSIPVEAADEQAKATLEGAQRTAERQQRHVAALQQRAQLDRDQVTHQQRIEQLQRAARAAEVAPLLQLVSDASGEVDRLTSVVGQADVGALSARLEAVVADISTCSGLFDDEARLASHHQARDNLQQAASLATAQRQSIADAEKVAAAGGHLHDTVASLTAQLEAATKRDRLQAELADCEPDLVRAERAELDARQAWVQLYEVQVLQRAALLADGLAEGDACPVCGSEEHPQLAVPPVGQDLVRDDQLEAAATRRDQATAELDRVQAAANDLRAALASATGAAAAGAVDDLRAALAEAQHGLELAIRAAQVLAVSVPAGTDASEYLDQLDQHISQAQQELGGLDTEIAGRRGRVEAALDGFSSLQERVGHLVAEKESIEVTLGEVAALTQARTELGHRTVAAEAEACARQFATLDEVRNALLDDAARDGLEVLVESHKASCAAVDADLRDPGLIAAAGQPPVDLAAVAAAAEAAEKAWAEQRAAVEDARRVAAKVADRRDALCADVDRLQPLLEDRRVKHELSLLASGNDRSVSNRMRLSTYVLAARLEQVAAAASERLLRMSDGRYTLVHTDEARGNQKGGLGLQVVDAWTSTVRDTSSLSGGETFFASLALALGVADVVTAETGGGRIDTLFIDEGFGSLDDETLHQVMDVLDDLRSGGRAVGIVSHVADLRSRIATQVEVIKTSSGSSVRTQTPSTSATFLVA